MTSQVRADADRAWGPSKGAWDGCEYNPREGRGAETIDRHFRTTRATIVLGSQIAWRLCDSCAALSVFAHVKRRYPI